MITRNDPIVLLSAAAATGPAVNVPDGGRAVFSIVGTFGGTTAQLQLRGQDGATFINVANGSFTSAGAVAVDVPVNSTWRVTLTGGAPTGIYAGFDRVP